MPTVGAADSIHSTGSSSVNGCRSAGAGLREGVCNKLLWMIAVLMNSACPRRRDSGRTHAKCLALRNGAFVLLGAGGWGFRRAEGPRNPARARLGWIFPEGAAGAHTAVSARAPRRRPRWGGGKAGDAVSAFTQVRVQSGTPRLDRALQADRCCGADSTGARGLRGQWAASHPARFGATCGKSFQPAG